LYALDQPWPANYLSWLLDPSGTIVQTFTFPGYYPPRTVTYVHLGILAGDFGYSLFVDPGIPVLAVYGLDPRLFPVILATLLCLLLIALLQRRGRPSAWHSSRIPANAHWRLAELWTMS
jgi:hypothetical protein